MVYMVSYYNTGCMYYDTGTKYGHPRRWSPVIYGIKRSNTILK